MRESSNGVAPNPGRAARQRRLPRVARRQALQAAVATRLAGSRVTLRAALIGACCVLFFIISPSVAQARGKVKELAPVVYTAIDGHTETLIPWQGRNVSVLVEPGVTRDPRVMTRLVLALDRAWSYYARTTGRLPGGIQRG